MENTIEELYYLKSNLTGLYWHEDEGFFSSRENATPVDSKKADRFKLNFYRLDVEAEPVVV